MSLRRVFGSVTIIFILFCNRSKFSYATRVAVEHFETALISNIVDTYGNNGTLSVAEVDKLIRNVIDSVHYENHENDGKISKEIEQACNSTKRLTVCKDVLSQTCLDEQVLSEIYANPGANRSWTDVFPALVWQLQSPTCQKKQEKAEHPHSHSKTPEGIAWAYGLGFSMMNCIISMSGGCMIPFMKFKMFKRILMYCVGLGVGVMASAGCLVLLPESLELTAEESPIPNYHFNMAIVLGGVYVCYLIRRLKSIWIGSRNKIPKEAKSIEIHVIDASEGLQIVPTEVSQDQDQGFCELPDDRPNGTNVTADTVSEAASATGIIPANETKPEKGQVATVAWMLLIGDGVHKFIDGVSVGASFTENVFTGISVGLAVLCEELPHELGDIALLLNAGMRIKQALFYNLLAVVPSFLGVCVGIVLGENTDATTWILAIAGGMFIYISLFDMLPEMDEQAKEMVEKGTDTPTMILLIQNLGLISAFVVIFLLVVFGDAFQV